MIESDLMFIFFFTFKFIIFSIFMDFVVVLMMMIII